MNDIETLLNSLSNAQMRRVMREIATYLRQRNAYRIRTQQNADGSRYQPRKDKTVKRRMLTGFSKHLKKRISADQVEVGIFGNAANLAHIHHDGQTEDGIQYPSRQLIGLPDEDQAAIRQMLVKHLTMS